LRALAQTIDRDPELSSIFGYYPVPHKDPRYQDWGWDSINPRFMVVNDSDWDVLHVPIFQACRQRFNREVLSSLGRPYEQLSEEELIYIIERPPTP
jgi:hypothetical protein